MTTQTPAPEGQTYVCAACGRENKVRMDVGDESCFLNAILVYENTIQRTASGRVLSAKAV